MNNVFRQSLLSRVENLFDENEIAYTRDEEELVFVLSDPEGYDITIRAMSIIDDKWLMFYVLACNLSDVEPENHGRVLTGLLRMNLELTGAKVALTKADEFIVIGETNDTDLTFSELSGILLNIMEGSILVHKAMEMF